MKIASLRLVLLIVSSLVAVGLFAQPPVENPDPGSGGAGGGSCSVCEGYSQGGYYAMRCAPSDVGVVGNRNCRVESYPEGTYCFLDGDNCCVVE